MRSSSRKYSSTAADARDRLSYLLTEDVDSAHRPLFVERPQGVDSIVEGVSGNISPSDSADNWLRHERHSVFHQCIEKTHENLLGSGAWAQTPQ